MKKEKAARARGVRSSKKKEDFAKGALRTKRAGMFGLTDFSKEANAMVGATIVATGFHEGAREGGFAVDFQHKGEPLQRLVLGYTELGEWVEFFGEVLR